MSGGKSWSRRRASVWLSSLLPRLGWLWGLPRHWVVGKPGAPRASLFLTSFCVLCEFQEVAFWLHFGLQSFSFQTFFQSLE